MIALLITNTSADLGPFHRLGVRGDEPALVDWLSRNYSGGCHHLCTVPHLCYAAAPTGRSLIYLFFFYFSFVDLNMLCHSTRSKLFREVHDGTGGLDGLFVLERAWRLF